MTLFYCIDGSRNHQGALLCVVNSHLFSNPAAPHIRTIQAAVLAAEVDQHYKDIAVIWCGDFNATHDSGVVDFLKTGTVSQFVCLYVLWMLLCLHEAG
eukprot:m.78577 g.78577  ORF g.78577 m.78577 type:complete len:98 (+) comp12539_c0_seq3:1882-2175(+)